MYREFSTEEYETEKVVQAAYFNVNIIYLEQIRNPLLNKAFAGINL